MKKLLKISILVGIFMAILTLKSHAATVEYGTLQSNGSMEVTVTLEHSPSSNTNFITRAQSEGWVFSGDNQKTMKKTFTGVNTKPAFEYRYFSYGENLYDTESISVATPYTMKVNESLTLHLGNNYFIQSSSEAVAVDPSTYKVTAVSKGQATITIRETTVQANTTYYSWDVTVADTGTPPDPTPTQDPTPAGATDFSGLKLTFNESDAYNRIVANVSGFTKDSGHTYRIYVSTSSTGSADYDSNKTTYFNTDDNGNNTILFTNDDAHILSEQTGDKYLHIIDTYYEGSTKKTNVTNRKITETITVSRPVGARFDVYLYNSDASHICNNMSVSTDRKVTYKVGVVKSSDVLRAFKSNEATGFNKLLAYAKEDSSQLKTGSFDIPNTTISAKLDYNLINDINITANTYYYIYYTVSTNDGKYVELEDVQIYQACDLGTNGTIVHFAYGSMDIPDDGTESGSGSEEKEKPSTDLPNAGEKAIIFAAIGISALGAVVLFKKVKTTKIK